MTTVQHKSKMSVTQLTLLTALNMLGSGIIMLPSKIGRIGGISLLTWAVVGAAAIAMAYAFAYCGMYSKGRGGLGSIAENAFGRFGSFITNFVYGISLFLADGAIATSGVVYLCELFSIENTPVLTQSLTVLMLWSATAAILMGAEFIGKLGALSIWGIFIPVLCLLCVGPFFFDASCFSANWNPHGYTNLGSIQSAMPMMFWSFLGLESALANGDSVENPEKSVPKAVLTATAGVAFLYVASTVIFTGLFPNDAVVGKAAPLSLAFTYIFGPSASRAFSLFLFLSMWGSLMGWQFTMARVFAASAREGFLPSLFGKDIRHGIPVRGLLLLVFLQTLLVFLVPYADAFQRFDVLVNLSVVTNVFPYLTCMAAIFALRRQSGAPRSESASAVAAATAGLLFLVCYFFFIESVIMKFGFLLLLSGFVLYGIFFTDGDRENESWAFQVPAAKKAKTG